MADLSAALKLVLQLVDADPKLGEWLLSEGLTECEDVALITSEEKQLDESLLNVAKAGGVPMDKLSDKIKKQRRYG